MSVQELIENNDKTKLLELCEKHNIKCIKSWSKPKIAEALFASGKLDKSNKNKTSTSSRKFASRKSASRKSASRKSVSKKSASRKSNKDSSNEGLSCDMDENTCVNSKKYVKADIVALAIKCGVDSTGSRKQICARIAAKMSGDVDVDVDVDVDDINAPEQGVLSVEELIKNNSQKKLFEMCEQKKLECKKSWTKPKLAQAIYDANNSDESDKPKSPPKSPPKMSGENKCYEDLMKKTAKELSLLLDKAGVKSGKPTIKTEMAGYLCAIAQNKRCDYEKGIKCDDDLVCDASNTPGVCISPNFVNQKIKTMMWEGKKIIGTTPALAKLKKLLEKMKSPSPSPGPTPSGPTPSRTPTPPRPPTPPRQTPTPSYTPTPITKRNQIKIKDYYEKQEEGSSGCGRHALNNLFGQLVFIKEGGILTPKLFKNMTIETDKIPLQSICKMLLQEGMIQPKKGKKGEKDEVICPDDEDYDSLILQAGLGVLGYSAKIPDIQEKWKDTKDTNDEDVIGYIVNFGAGHWVSFRKLDDGKYKYIDSVGNKPKGEINTLNKLKEKYKKQIYNFGVLEVKFTGEFINYDKLVATDIDMKLEKGQYKTGDIINYQPETEDEEGEYIVIDPVRDPNASHDDRKIIGYWLVRNTEKVRSFLKDGNFTQEFTKDDSKLTKNEKIPQLLKNTSGNRYWYYYTSPDNKSPTPSRTPTPPRPPTPPRTPRTPKPDDGFEVKPSVKPNSKLKPDDGDEIIEPVDIEKILENIKQRVGGEEIDELASTQKAVLKCLGLLS